MSQQSEAAQIKLRSIAEIFEDLQELAQSDGALHSISRLIYRDHFVVVDMQEGCVVDKPENRWSTSKLNKNEMLLLLGLMVQSSTDHTYVAPSNSDDFLARADALFGELHSRLLADVSIAFDFAPGAVVERSNLIGLCGRESIYYGAETLYLHQFLEFSQIRYGKDKEWFLQNIGISICSILEITKFILKRINSQMTVMGHLCRKGYVSNDLYLTQSLLISKEDLIIEFGTKAEAYFSKFVSPVTETNERFRNPFAINNVALSPIIDIGDNLYVPIEYRLCESIYESPFFWMMAD